MRDNKVIQVVAVVFTVSALATMMIIERGGFGPSINSSLHRAVGAEIARQTLSQLKPGGQIMVITRDPAMFPNPATDLLLEGFQRELRQAHTSISTLQQLQVDPLRLIAVPSGDFQRWIHHATDKDVIVSFVGPPVLTTAQLKELGKIEPAIVAFCPGNWPDQMDFRRLFEQGLLSTAIVSQHDPSNSHGSQALFDQNFQIRFIVCY